MSILNVENVTHGFGARRILEDASFRLLKGEHVGLVGANGEGKSTFLNIITGKLMPDEGKVSWCNHITTGYLDQSSTLTKGKTIRDVLREAFAHMYQMEQEMLGMYEKMSDCTDEEMAQLMEDVGEIQDMLEHSGFYVLDSRIEEYSNGLGLGEIGLDRDVGELSGGQRTKVLLTKLLLENPMILILDEPTNFLDENHITWLKNFLQNYENAFILVSHDIPFLNSVVNVVYHIEDAILTRYKGNYDDFTAMYELKKRQLEQAYEKQQKEIAHLEDFIARNKARVATTNMAKSRQKKLDKMEIIELGREKPKPIFAFTPARSTGRVVIETKDLVLGYDEPLTAPLNLLLEKGQKVAIKGVNGLGKSTLLKTLLGIQPPISGTVELDPYVETGYFEQEHAAGSHTALDEIWREYPGMTNAQVRGALAKCGLTTEHIESQLKVLSGGENAKVRLCKLMLQSINLLVLDEPTNHLDTDAKEALKSAVADFKGTVLLVSHEPEFYSDIVSDVWNLDEWTTKIV
ncbi:ATPase subunit of ABC transporter with duplicated ATPase domains [Hydrogenoanaerobacterium saccharovorans]|uniref:ATPase components of ABC transporters with duplicated ATPase domains n=1 Tax=Hydrogenoanaerobacterium saccharovorans TaxID=474960 RepID=A0A1H7YP83_9FIRM|nr:ABC-F family ATP-binding cassette domain-containing protein [Hydrogenoanaerobacterium saccharovorans]RPF49141.1 ATPase subunit of ABC transporter with duplicated ATPase domains [Hydrogenoanaerobacterium saccharovorans]SEM46989.1 ATPase components of ABC transporters with duplicated ATPase domains [Hydrogenoanaerobacterium saccharovorans]